MRPQLVIGSLASLFLVMCTFEWDAFDPRLGAGGAGGAQAEGGGGLGGVGGVGGRGGMGGVAGMGGDGGMGGGGGPPTLTDRGLIARYFINEAASGTGPAELIDVAPDPVNLQLRYGEVNDALPMGGAGGTGGTGGGGGMGGSPPGGPNMMFTEVDGHRGLTWIHKNISGRARSPVANTKFLGLDGATEATIECVAEVEDAGGGSACGRISHLGVNNFGSFTLCAESAMRLEAFFNGREVEKWTVDFRSLDRIALHYVLDTTATDASDRVRAYIDGVSLGPGDAEELPPDEAEAVALSSGEYVLGNRNNNAASLESTLFYCALYGVALTDAEIANNAMLLLASDD